jgi:hypothetical protein
MSRDAAESLLPVVVPTQAAPAQAIPTHGLADVADLDVTTAKAGGGGTWVVSSGAKAGVATVDEVAIKEAEIRVYGDGVHVSLSVPTLETEQSCSGGCYGESHAWKSVAAEL